MIVVQFVYVIPGLPTREDFKNKVFWSHLDWQTKADIKWLMTQNMQMM